MPAIVPAPDTDRSALAAELLALAGDTGSVEIQTHGPGLVFEVDDETFAAWREAPGGASETDSDADETDSGEVETGSDADETDSGAGETGSDAGETDSGEVAAEPLELAGDVGSVEVQTDGPGDAGETDSGAGAARSTGSSRKRRQ